MFSSTNYLIIFHFKNISFNVEKRKRVVLNTDFNDARTYLNLEEANLAYIKKNTNIKTDNKP